MANLPDTVPVLTDPSDAEHLNGDLHGKSLGELIRETNAEVVAGGRQLAGAFANPKGYVTVAASPLANCVSLTSDTPNNGTWTASFGSGGVLSLSGPWVQVTKLNSGTGRLSCNFAGTVATAGYAYIAFDVQLADKVADSIYISAMIASGATLTGTTSATVLPVVSSTYTTFTVLVPIGAVTAIKSLGLKVGTIPGAGTSDRVTARLGNIRFATYTGLDQARSMADTILVPADYAMDADQAFQLADTTKTEVDLRVGHEVVPGLDGVKHLRQFGLEIDETATVDVGAKLLQVFASLSDGDYLLFPKGKRFLCASAFFTIAGLKDVTIDLNGSTLLFAWEEEAFQFGLDVGNPDYTTQGMTFRNGKILGTRPATQSVSSDHGTPALVGGSWNLSTMGDAVKSGPQGFILRDVDGNWPVDITLSDTAHVPNDVMIEWYDYAAPAAPTASVVGTDGPIVAGQTLYYWVVAVYADYQLSGFSRPATVTTSAWCRVQLTMPAVPSTSPPVIAWRLFRGSSGGASYPGLPNYDAFDEIDVTTTTYIDNQPVGNTTVQTSLPTLANLGAGNVDAGTQQYVVTSVLTSGQETIYNQQTGMTQTTTVSISLGQPSQVQITLPHTGDGAVAQRRVYRIWSTGSHPERGLVLLPNGVVNDNSTVSIVDNTSNHDLTLIRVPSNGANAAADPMPDFPTTVIPLLTSTPTVYRFAGRPGPRALRAQCGIRIRKKTTTANTISVGTVTGYGQSGYDSAHEGGHGVENFSVGLTLEDLVIEGKSGDGVRQQGYDATLRRVTSRACGRQGMSYNGGGLMLLEDCDIGEAGRSGFDFEPGSALQTAEVLTFRRCEFHNSSNNQVELHWCDAATLDGCRFTTRGGTSTLQGIDGGGDRLTIVNTDMRWGGATLSGQNIFIDNFRYSTLEITEADQGGTAWLQRRAGRNCIIGTIYGGSAPIISIPNAHIGRVILDNFPITRVADETEADPIYGMIDTPGSGVIVAGPLSFPSGFDVRDVPVKNVRGVSSTAVAANNARGTVAVLAGATSAAIVFPSHAYSSSGFGYNLSGFQNNSGTLAAGTYYVRGAPRPRAGGPILASSQQSVTLSGSQNAIDIQISLGFAQGYTFYIGTVSGTYTRRYDVLPSEPVSKLAQYYSSPSNRHDFAEYGNLLLLEKPGVNWDSAGYGFPSSFAPTPVVSSPSNLIPADETGSEADTNYTLSCTFRATNTPSTHWFTRYEVVPTRTGATVYFESACPTGGGTMDWVLDR